MNNYRYLVESSRSHFRSSKAQNELFALRDQDGTLIACCVGGLLWRRNNISCKKTRAAMYLDNGSANGDRTSMQ